MKKPILEDAINPNSNRQAYGNTARQDSKQDNQQNPTPSTVGELLKNNKKKDAETSAPQLKPYPLHMADDVISTMFVASSNLRLILQNAGNNIQSIIENPERRKAYLHNIAYASRRLELIDKAIVDISREIDKIGE
jgi:hypothetical protein